MWLFKTCLGWAAIPVRLSLGVTFMLHGSQKLFSEQGVTEVINMMQRLGMHPATGWAWLIIILEFFGGIAIALGLATRPVAFASPDANLS